MSIKTIIGSLVISLFASAASAECVEGLEGKVIKVSDGDTVKILDADKKTHKLRLAGIDAPEKNKHLGRWHVNFYQA